MPRPKKPKHDRYSEEIRIKVRPALKAMVQQAAASKCLEESAFVRSLIEQSVRNQVALAV